MRLADIRGAECLAADGFYSGLFVRPGRFATAVGAFLCAVLKRELRVLYR